MAENLYASPESDVSRGGAEIETGGLFSKKGRLNVASYWGQYLVITLISYLFMFGGAFVGALLGGEQAGGLIGGVIYVIAAIVSTVIIIMMTIKRLHDRNMNGWWILTMFIVVGVIFLLLPAKRESNRFGAWRPAKLWETIFAWLMLIVTIASIGGLVWFYQNGGLATLAGQ